jgi:hypothetical protein
VIPDEMLDSHDGAPPGNLVSERSQQDERSDHFVQMLIGAKLSLDIRANADENGSADQR